MDRISVRITQMATVSRSRREANVGNRCRRVLLPDLDLASNQIRAEPVCLVGSLGSAKLSPCQKTNQRSASVLRRRISLQVEHSFSCQQAITLQLSDLICAFQQQQSDRLRVALDSTWLVLGTFNVFSSQSVLVPTQRRLSHELASFQVQVQVPLSDPSCPFPA